MVSDWSKLCLLQKQGFGGVTIEVWSQILPGLQTDLTHFLIHLGDLLHTHDKILILVVPPTNVAPTIGLVSSVVSHFNHFSELPWICPKKF